MPATRRKRKRTQAEIEAAGGLVRRKNPSAGMIRDLDAFAEDEGREAFKSGSKPSLPVIRRLIEFRMMNFTSAELARRLDTTASKVNHWIQKGLGSLFDEERAEVFSDNRVTMLTNMEANLLEAISEKELSDVSAHSLMKMLKEAHAMRRLEQGMSTANTSIAAIVLDLSREEPMAPLAQNAVHEPAPRVVNA